jgi:hypothetical protein
MHDTSLRQFRLTRNAVLVDLESAAKECSSNGRERVEDAVGPMVKRRGNLEDGGWSPTNWTISQPGEEMQQLRGLRDYTSTFE